MSVGPLKSHECILCGHLTLTLTDGEGNIKSVRRHHNIINGWAKRLISSCAHNGGAGVSALYVYIASGNAGWNPSVSCAYAFSEPCTGASINITNNPATLTWSHHNDVQWSINGTMTFVGYGGYSSVNAAALVFGTAKYTLSISDAPLNSWWAAACFTDLAINSVDKLSFNWAFSLSTTTSTAV